MATTKQKPAKIPTITEGIKWNTPSFRTTKAALTKVLRAWIRYVK